MIITFNVISFTLICASLKSAYGKSANDSTQVSSNISHTKVSLTGFDLNHVTNDSRHFVRNECKTTRIGLDYMGTVSKTIDGDECQAWISQYPHIHTSGIFDHEFPEKNVSRAENFCRNPANDSYGPYCYTMDLNTEWQYCMIPKCSEVVAGVHPECKSDRRGTQYMGKISHTENGRLCLPWFLFPNYNDEDFPDDNIDEAFNHCRNPSNSINGPYCYSISDDGYYKESFCYIPYCSSVIISDVECKTTAKGIDYAGTKSETIYGDQCQMWSSQYPHKHFIGIYNHEFPENNVSEAKNYCRNVHGIAKYGPWCYTTNSKREWAYCLVPLCNEPAVGIYQECKSDRRGINYRGKMNITLNGTSCFPWHIDKYYDKYELKTDKKINIK